MLTFILQVAFFQFLFLGVYVLLLRKETFFNYNRLYLLISSVLALLLPFIKINVFARIVPETLLVNLPAVLLGTSNTVDALTPHTNFFGAISPSSFVFNYMFVWALGAVITLMIFGYKFYKMYSLKQLNTVVQEDNCTIITLVNSNDAFSFFKTIYIGDQLTLEAQKTILIHEKAHIQQFHSLDLLWFEILRIVFWFNPLVYVYQQQITETHEFIADQSAGKKQQNYYESLLAKTFGIQQFTFVNQFYSSSLIKKRIIMLTRKQSSKKQLIKYLSIIPLVIGMLFYVSCSDTDVNSIKGDKIENEIQLSKNSFTLIEREISFKTIEEVHNYNWNKLSEEFKSGAQMDSIILIVNNNINPQNVRTQLSGTPEEVSQIVEKAKSFLLGSDITDVAFKTLDKSPIFPGCDEDDTNDALKKCFSLSISKFVNENFDTKLAATLGLTGRQKILVLFKIDSGGNITEVRARAPHPTLKAEAIRVIKALPQMKPGEHNGKTVNVPYSLPIIFAVN